MNATTASRDALATQLADGLGALGVHLDAARQRALLDYLALLEKWNAVYNLTAIRGAEQMVTQHLLDSLAILPHLPDGHSPTFLDVGTGAGLPGIPVALARPALRVTLLDSSRKKQAFLQESVGALRLANAEVVCARIEAWQPGRRFDLIASRAFADLAEFATLAAPHLAEGGVLLAMKGLHPYDEIARLPAGWCVRDVRRLAVPGLAAERHLVTVARQ